MARDASIDVLKGISILSIMLLHYEQGLFPGWLNVWIGNFMISALYFSSGWVQSNKPDSTFKELIRKRWHTLGIPYLCFSALLIGVSLVFWAIGHYEFRIVLRDIYKTLTLRGIGTLWFLPALFGGEVLAWRFRHDGLLGRAVLVVVTIAFVCLYAHWDSTCAHSGDWWRMADAPFRTLHDILKA